MWQARIYVTLKKGVLDPQGRAIENALKVMSYGEVRDVRVGKFMVLTIDAPDRETAAARVEEMCRRLLANPVIEQYQFDLAPQGEAAAAGSRAGTGVWNFPEGDA
ncbi:MAG TPA: phosphoribosylformylglycinamidine synthase subunit PurS [Bacillota bacterium]|jgi:phosphoribosylformylglycinamidine synthase